ncbi:PAS domain S-box-containing protein/diguanylate cyclase (GGDEF)-like protein [Alkalispirillum mobile]|uniref:PAS domain S-box-containing protein/diguanylate cyclase (GGDEF)-like protein n=2 Tax=Alkalispirillum mobile TaxID=85925 RepID=A0A498CCN3_9GAMM|nr:PAS domain S-box-containing protein/diguanylate cyclase (GGDEF)-like protein [Alkalispirillum mobile]
MNSPLVPLPIGATNHMTSENPECPGRASASAALGRLKQAALDISTTAVVLVDYRQSDQPVVYVNRAFEMLTGYAAAEVVGRNCRFLQGNGVDVDARELDKIRQALNEGDEGWAILANQCKDGTPFWNELQIAPLRDDRGAITHYVGYLSDITQLKSNEELLAHHFTHDTLTQLPNRQLLLDRTEQAIASANRTEQSVALVHLDLDQFHLVNEGLGRWAGDQVLVSIGERLRQNLRTSDTVARTSSDQFAILLTNLEQEADVAPACDCILQVVRRPVSLGEVGERSITASMGVAVYPRDGTTADALSEAAEVAMADAKRGGDNHYRYFTEELNRRAAERLRLEERLRVGLAEDRIQTWFQPKVDFQTGEVVGVEALVRWQDPEWGWITPDRFIPVAESVGLIDVVTERVIRACGQLHQRFQRACLSPIAFAINLSPRLFQRPDITRTLLHWFQEYQLPPERVFLEITESLLVDDEVLAGKVLHELRRNGISISLDDFGTGYSNLSYLRSIPVDELKIDKLFMGELTREVGNAAIVNSIIALGHNLGMRVVAEGVETEAQVRYLRARGCDLLQGYHFSPAVPADGLLEMRLENQVMATGSGQTDERRPTVLLVDDEPNVLKALRRVLTPEGYRILIAGSGEQALEVLALEQVEVLITDQRMPGMSGTELLSRVRRLYPDTLRIVLSGYAELESLTDAINQGAIYKYLTKPWEDDDLRALLREALRERVD